MSLMYEDAARQPDQEPGCQITDDPDDLYPEIPAGQPGELPAGEPDVPRNWCASCGLDDAPEREWLGDPVPCPRCRSPWRWYGRLADRDGTAAGPPAGMCLECYEWGPYTGGQQHFGWRWRCICQLAHNGWGGWSGCSHDHHQQDVWMA